MPKSALQAAPAVQDRIARLEAVIATQALLMQHDGDTDRFMAAVIDGLLQVTAATSAMVELIDGEDLITRAISPHPTRRPGARTPRDGGLSGACLAARQVVCFTDNEVDRRGNLEAPWALGPRSCACAPLTSGDGPVGVLTIMAEPAHAFGADDIKLLELFANTIGGRLGREKAIERARREAGKLRRLEQSLRASEARASHLIARAGRAIISMSGDGLVTGWNATAERTFGWTEAEAVGVDLADLIIPERRRAMHLAGLERVRRHGPSDKMGQAGEIDALRKDGASITVELVVNAVPAGEGWEFIAILQDVTQRRAQAEKFEIAFNNAPIGLALTELDGRFAKVNRALADMLGYSVDELTGRTYHAITHPEDIDVSEDARFRLRAGETQAIPVEKRYLHKDGRTVWVKVTVSAVPNADGAPKQFIAQTEDLTERKESEARYQLMAENVTDVLMTSDLEGRVVFVSPACRTVMGCEPSAFLGRTPADDIHPDDLPAFKAMLGRVANGEPGERVRWRQRRLDNGAERWLETMPSLMCFAGTPSGFVAVVRDVTDSVAREKELEEARQDREAQAKRFEIAFENAPIGLALSHPDLTEGRINGALCRMLGYSADEIRRINFQGITYPDDLPLTRDLVEQLRSGEISNFQQQKRYIHKDGHTVWTYITVAMVRDSAGRPIQMIAQVQDQSELRKAESRFKLMADNATDMIVTSDADGRVTFASPRCRDILGCAPEDLIGRTPVDVLYPDDAAILDAALERAARGEQGPSIRWRIRRHGDGSVVWVESNPSLMSLPDEPAAFVDVIRDVTAQVAQEQALNEARQEAEQATAAKSEFLANMSHEIRTPLTAVVGFNKLLRDSATLAGADRAMAERAGSAGRALLGVVNNILDFSKIEAGQFDLSMRPASARQVVEEAVALFETQALEKGLDLTLEVCDAVPEAALFDPERLRQILLNLIANALKFTDEGGIAVRLDHGLGRLMVEVQDSGCGLDAGRQALLFKRFSQADPSTTRRYGGTGLGLAICKALVEVMGGEIGVVSAPGQGSTFHFSVMAYPPTGYSCCGEVPDQGLARLDGLSVLVVDDNPLNLELADAILSGAGAQVSHAADGLAALNAAAARAFDAVLLDIRMPGIDGLEVLKRIRSREGPNRTTPVLAFCADGDIGPYRQARFDGFVRKPIDTGELLQSIADAV